MSHSSSQAPKLVILGFGNLLMGDEGIGIHIINLLREKNLPNHVEIVDGGTAATKIFHFLEGVTKLVVVDAIRTGGKPGTIHRKQIKNVSTLRPSWGFSQHQLGVGEAMLMTKLEGKLPENIVLVGVEPKDVSPGTRLSREVAMAIPKVLEFVMEEVHKECSSQN
ncbi:MAG: hydrogenase maturation protease [Methanobacteriota archaeon]|nr:MAG: hydrogenase maturation protease [Euryarchaeota archaeon]